ncbi:MAG: hypothetical protein S4CHLAM102_15990 [Chlamydiia bacterium]|nr:hypothetical protein [Chlamydiia bacterium]
MSAHAVQTFEFKWEQEPTSLVPELIQEADPLPLLTSTLNKKRGELDQRIGVLREMLSNQQVTTISADEKEKWALIAVGAEKQLAKMKGVLAKAGAQVNHLVSYRIGLKEVDQVEWLTEVDHPKLKEAVRRLSLHITKLSNQHQHLEGLCQAYEREYELYANHSFQNFCQTFKRMGEEGGGFGAALVDRFSRHAADFGIAGRFEPSRYIRAHHSHK